MQPTNACCIDALTEIELYRPHRLPPARDCVTGSNVCGRCFAGWCFSPAPTSGPVPEAVRIVPRRELSMESFPQGTLLIETLKKPRLQGDARSARCSFPLFRCCLGHAPFTIFFHRGKLKRILLSASCTYFKYCFGEPRDSSSTMLRSFKMP